MAMVKGCLPSYSQKCRSSPCLVNNAGLALGLTAYQDYAEWDMLTMLDTNIKGLMMVTRQILPSMVVANEGHIINMGSTAGIYAYAVAVYSATKAAGKTFSDGLRIDTIATDIKVTTIQPGIVETDFSHVPFTVIRTRQPRVSQGFEALQAQDIGGRSSLRHQSNHDAPKFQIMTVMANQQATGFTIHRGGIKVSDKAFSQMGKGYKIRSAYLYFCHVHIMNNIHSEPL